MSAKRRKPPEGGPPRRRHARSATLILMIRVRIGLETKDRSRIDDHQKIQDLVLRKIPRAAIHGEIATGFRPKEFFHATHIRFGNLSDGTLRPHLIDIHLVVGAEDEHSTTRRREKCYQLSVVGAEVNRLDLLAVDNRCGHHGTISKVTICMSVGPEIAFRQWLEDQVPDVGKVFHPLIEAQFRIKRHECSPCSSRHRADLRPKMCLRHNYVIEEKERQT